MEAVNKFWKFLETDLSIEIQLYKTTKALLHYQGIRFVAVWSLLYSHNISFYVKYRYNSSLFAEAMYPSHLWYAFPLVRISLRYV